MTLTLWILGLAVLSGLYAYIDLLFDPNPKTLTSICTSLYNIIGTQWSLGSVVWIVSGHPEGLLCDILTVTSPLIVIFTVWEVVMVVTNPQD
jgi:hypothetical protein